MLRLNQNKYTQKQDKQTKRHKFTQTYKQTQAKNPVFLRFLRYCRYFPERIPWKKTVISKPRILYYKISGLILALGGEENHQDSSSGDWRLEISAGQTDISIQDRAKNK